MFEVLIYLFENYLDGSVALNVDQDVILAELESAGFQLDEIDRALDWLDGLNRFTEKEECHPAPSSNAMRYYMPEEIQAIGMSGIGFILYLEQISILDPATREIVIDRLVALEQRELSLSRIKWVVLIALFNQPNKKSALSLLQDMILSEAIDVLH